MFHKEYYRYPSGIAYIDNKGHIRSYPDNCKSEVPQTCQSSSQPISSKKENRNNKRKYKDTDAALEYFKKAQKFGIYDNISIDFRNQMGSSSKYGAFNQTRDDSFSSQESTATYLSLPNQFGFSKNSKTRRQSEHNKSDNSKWQRPSTTAYKERHHEQNSSPSFSSPFDWKQLLNASFMSESPSPNRRTFNPRDSLWNVSPIVSNETQPPVKRNEFSVTSPKRDNLWESTNNLRDNNSRKPSKHSKFSSHEFAYSPTLKRKKGSWEFRNNPERNHFYIDNSSHEKPSKHSKFGSNEFSYSPTSVKSKDPLDYTFDTLLEEPPSTSYSKGFSPSSILKRKKKSWEFSNNYGRNNFCFNDSLNRNPSKHSKSDRTKADLKADINNNLHKEFHSTHPKQSSNNKSSNVCQPSDSFLHSLTLNSTTFDDSPSKYWNLSSNHCRSSPQPTILSEPVDQSNKTVDSANVNGDLSESLIVPRINNAADEATKYGTEKTKSDIGVNTLSEPPVFRTPHSRNNNWKSQSGRKIMKEAATSTENTPLNYPQSSPIQNTTTDEVINKEQTTMGISNSAKINDEIDSAKEKQLFKEWLLFKEFQTFREQLQTSKLTSDTRTDFNKEEYNQFFMMLSRKNNKIHSNNDEKETSKEPSKTDKNYSNNDDNTIINIKSCHKAEGKNGMPSPIPEKNVCESVDLGPSIFKSSNISGYQQPINTPITDSYIHSNNDEKEISKEPSKTDKNYSSKDDNTIINTKSCHKAEGKTGMPSPIPKKNVCESVDLGPSIYKSPNITDSYLDRDLFMDWLPASIISVGRSRDNEIRVHNSNVPIVDQEEENVERLLLDRTIYEFDEDDDKTLLAGFSPKATSTQIAK